MINRLGYACININLKPKSFKDCRLNSVYKYGIDYLRDKIIDNLNLVKEVLKWNMKNNIFMYRISSRIMPLVTHPDMLKDFTFRWYEDEEILNIMKEIKEMVLENNIRLTMHPDQFTVINSLSKEVVKNSISNLAYHCQVLKKLGGKDVVIHIGGVYGDKTGAIKRFIEVFNTLDNNIKDMIRLENDDKSYDIDDVFYISKKTSIPVLLDIHHHRCNHTRVLNHEDMIRIKDSWSKTGLIPKVHISSGHLHGLDRKHHDYIKEEDVERLLKIIGNMDIDLMIEAKKKDLSALKVGKYLDNKKRF